MLINLNNMLIFFSKRALGMLINDMLINKKTCIYRVMRNDCPVRMCIIKNERKVNEYMFFFISISFISIPEARFEKKISILFKLISILPRLRLKKNRKWYFFERKIQSLIWKKKINNMFLSFLNVIMKIMFVSS